MTCTTNNRKIAAQGPGPSADGPGPRLALRGSAGAEGGKEESCERNPGGVPFAFDQRSFGVHRERAERPAQPGVQAAPRAVCGRSGASVCPAVGVISVHTLPVMEIFFRQSSRTRSLSAIPGIFTQKTAGAFAPAVHADSLTGEKFHGKINRLCGDGG